MTTFYPILTVKADRAPSVVFRHPWLFSGAFEKIPHDLEHGALVHVADPEGKILGTGTFSKKSSIAVRVFEFGVTEIAKDWLKDRLEKAHERRLLLGYGPKTETTGYRVAFSETDNLPGLIVDRYEDVLVIQISTAGMEALKPMVIEALQELFKPVAIIERSDLHVREEEGMKSEVNVLFGEAPESIEFLENGYTFYADVLQGQKTGFFCDQKDLRAALQPLAKGREVLNLFSYTGATNVYAFKGGAKSIHCVDSSESALAGCEKNLKLNRLGAKKLTVEAADAFQWLNDHKEPAYDMVLIDPPAIIKNKKDSEEGKKAYHFLNRAALRLVRNGGIFVTSSCSHFFSEEDFLFMLRRASVQSNLELDILKKVTQSPDHPVSAYFPESAYLKSFIGVVHRFAPRSDVE